MSKKVIKKKIIIKKEPKKNIEIVETKHEILETGKQTPKIIYHLSDIHISKHNYRYTEYRQVFNRLCEILRKEKEEFIIVLTGDITHEKSQLSPQQIDLTKDFFIMLASIAPLIMIIGNHDINPNQDSPIDSISSIIKNFPTKYPIYLLLDDKTYEYNDIVFGLTTMSAKKVTKCEKNINKINIGLYHGMLKKDENDSDISNTGTFTVTDFMDQYDLCLLGDIHKFGYLNKNKTIAYAGSLIQQNIGEDLEHGIIRWDLQDNTSSFVNIKNDYGMMKIEINNNIAKPYDEKIIPKYPQFYIYYNNMTTSDADIFGSKLLDKYKEGKYILHNVKTTIDTNISIGSNTTKKNITDIKDNETSKKTIMEYAVNKDIYKKFTESAKKEFDVYLDNFIKELKYNYGSVSKKIKLKSLKFNNFFLYKIGNEINFKKVNKIVGIVGPSYSGKSTVIDVILYSIFGEASRGTKFNTINTNANEMKTVIEFNVNNEMYSISRTRTRRSKKNNESTEKVVVMKNDENITGDTCDITNKLIQDNIGSYNDFVNVSVMLQKGTNSFIDMTDMTRRDLVCRLLKLDMFSEIFKSAKNRLTVLNKEIGNINKKEMTDKLKIYDTNKKDTENKIIKITKQYNDLDKNIDIEKKKLMGYEIKMEEFNKLDISIKTIKSLNINIANNELKINRCEKDNVELEEKKTELLNNLSVLDKELEKYVNIEEEHKKFNANKKQEIEILSAKYEKIISSKKKVPDIKCNIVIVTKNMANYKIEKEKLIETIKDIQHELDSIKIVKTKQNKNIETNYNKLIETRDKLEDAQSEYDAIKEETDEVKKKLKKLVKHEFDPDCKFCMKYSVTQDKINYENEINKNNEMIAEYKKKISEHKSAIKKLLKYENQYIAYKKQINDNEINTELVKQHTNNLLLFTKDIEIVNAKIENCAREISEYNSINTSIIENNKIDEECTIIKNDINIKNNEKDEKYNMYNELRDQKNNCDIDIVIINNKIQENRNTYKEISIQLDKQKHEKETYNKNLKNIEEHKKNTSEYDVLKKMNEANLKKYDELKKTLKELNYTLIDETHKYNNQQIIIDKQLKKYNEKDMLELIIKVHEDGMVNDILEKTVLPVLQGRVNDILEIIGEYKVQLKCSTKGIFIEKVRKDKTLLNIDILSGCESVLVDIAFRLALSEYNNFVKTDFIIIDEVFRFCDNINIEKISVLFEYIRKQFTWALIISHDERITKLYDKEIIVKTNGCNSEIVYK